MLAKALNDLRDSKSNTRALQIIATFTGEDPEGRLKTGHRYELIVVYSKIRDRFELHTRNALTFRRYKNADAFIKDWNALAIRKGA